MTGNYRAIRRVRDALCGVLASLLAATAGAEFRERLKADGSDPAGSSPGQYARFLRTEIEKWRKVIAFAGAKPE